VLKTTQAGFGTPGGWSGSLPSKAHSVVYGKGTGQDGILRPIGNRPYNFLHSKRRITNPPQVANLPHQQN
jgi:hypothetical protein